MNFFVLIGIYVVLNAFGQLFIKIGSYDLKTATSLWDILTNFTLMGGIVLFGMSFLTWIYILTKSNLSYAFPFAVGLGYVAVIMLAVFVLKEVPNTLQIAGMVLVGIGVMLMSMQHA